MMMMMMEGNTTCTSLFVELQSLWDEIGESDEERDAMILQLEKECLDVYRRKVDLTRKLKADFHQALAKAEVEASTIISALGENELYTQFVNPKGTLKEQVAAIKPALDSLRKKKEERLIEFVDIQLQLSRISEEIAGNTYDDDDVSSPQVDGRVLTLKRLGELKNHLEELQKDKKRRIQKVNSCVQMIHELTSVLCLDFNQTIAEIHPKFENPTNAKPISDATLARLEGVVNSLNKEKNQRLRKLKDLGSALVELWNLMETPTEEQERFNRVTALISASDDKVLDPNSLAAAVIEQAEIEIGRLNVLKASKMKEIVLKKQNELEDIYRSVHMDVDGDTTKQRLINLIETGSLDLAELLTRMGDQIAKAKEQALCRKEILDKVEKWKFTCEEAEWLEDYERDQNRYNARGAHKNFKRAEKARILINKLPSLVENLIAKVKSWEKEKGVPFYFEKMKLLELLEEYNISRQQKEEEKRRSREHKKLQEQYNAEQDMLYGTKPSPLRHPTGKKPLGQSSIVNMGTPRRMSTATGKPGSLSSSNKERKSKFAAPSPLNYVSLSKDDNMSRSHSAATP